MVATSTSLSSTRRRWAWGLLGAGDTLLVVEAANIGFQETAAAHDMTVARSLALCVALLAMAATYGLQICLQIGS